MLFRSETMPFGKYKVVLLDEADYLSREAQAVLRGLIESYSDFARFILTCNYPHRIIPALKSRCHTFFINKTDRTEFTARVATVLVTENIEFDLEILDSFVKATYPDLRKCLNSLQKNSVTGRLTEPGAGDGSVSEWRFSAVELIKQGRIRDARTVICSQATIEDIDDIFRWMYDNLDLWATDVHKQDQAIIIIRNGMANMPLVADQEINLSATISELCQL